MNEFEISKELEAKLAAARTLEDVFKICTEEGLDITMEQLEAMNAAAQDGELSDEALENIAGGCGKHTAIWHLIRFPLRPVFPIPQPPRPPRPWWPFGWKK